MAAQFEQPQDPLHGIATASAVTALPAPAGAVQGGRSQSFVCPVETLSS